MKLFQCFSQKLPIKMSIDLGSSDAFMTQHFLHGSQVGATFYKMCGKGMTEGMRRNSFCDAGFFYQVFDN